MKNLLFISLLISGVIYGQSFKQNYFVEQTIKGGAKKNGEYNFVEYSVKSNEGKELYQIVDKVDYDIPYSKLDVFEDGSSVLISAFNGRLTFISNDGAKTKIVTISNSLKVEYERTIHSVIDEESILILFDEQNSKTSIFQKYSRKGSLEREIRIPISNVNGIAYSQKLGQIYISNINWKNSGELSEKVTILNESGEVEKILNANFDKGFFTDRNQFIGISNKSIISINTSVHEFKFKAEADKNSIFIDITEENSSIVIAQAENPVLENGKWNYKNPTIKRVDSNGNTIKQKKYRVNVFSEYKFNKTQNGLQFITGKDIIDIE